MAEVANFEYEKAELKKPNSSLSVVCLQKNRRTRLLRFLGVTLAEPSRTFKGAFEVFKIILKYLNRTFEDL